uniref:TraB domain-containing protein n=1 Tax=Hemiscolopendra marginata TaxID=943146 RepID=A0A646QG71_9MYRI
MEHIDDAKFEHAESTDSGEELMDSEEEGSSDYDMDDDEENNMEARVFTRLERDPNPILPDTVTKLETMDGSKVYLVGTAHFSLESQDDVAKTIEATQPDVVMVELCKGRVNILQLDEKTILEEAKSMNLDKVRVAIRQNGFIQGVMYLLLLSMSAHFTKQLGMAPGGEFRRAFAEAKKVPGCLIHLGDRPIQITFQRAIAALSWWQKLRLAWFMITSKEPISKEEVERCKQRDLLEELLAEMTGEFPALSQVFVKERDIYLTHSLHLAANSVRGSYSKSNMVPVPAVVVGIVGMGHVPGIMENWGKISENDIPQLLKIPEASLSGKLMKYTFRASVLGLALWGCYKTIPFHKISDLLINSGLIWPLQKT